MLKSLIAGFDPGKRSTFTVAFLFVLQLLQVECPKLCSRLAMNFAHGRHASIGGSVPNYDFCTKIIKHF